MDELMDPFRHLPYVKRPDVIGWIDQTRAFLQEFPLYKAYCQAYHRGLQFGAPPGWLTLTAQLAYQFCQEGMEDDPEFWGPLREAWRKSLDEQHAENF